jgi:hypothetical protein
MRLSPVGVLLLATAVIVGLAIVASAMPGY